MKRAAIGALMLIAICASACGHKQEGPAPTHNSPDLHPIGPSRKSEQEQSNHDQAFKAAIEFARSKYGDKLNYKTASIEQTKGNILAPGVDVSAERKKEVEPNYQMWKVTIILTRVPVSQPQVDHDDLDPFPISERVFVVTNSMKVTEGIPLKIPSFVLQLKP